MAPFNVDYLLPLVKEFIRDSGSLLQESAGIIPKVENYTLHPFATKIDSRLHELRKSGCCKLRDADIARSVIDHEMSIHAVNGDPSSCNLEGYLVMTSFDCDIDFCPRWAFHPPDHAVLRETDSGNHLVVYLQQTVPYH